MSTERSAMLNALLSSLTGASVKLSVADYQALANADLKLDGLLAALKTELNVVDFEDVLTANLSLAKLYNAAASALVTQDGEAAATALGALLLVTLPDEPFALGDMLKLDLRDGALASSTINVLDLVMGSASLFNHKNAVTVEDVTVTGAALGLGALIKDLDLGVTVPVPPIAACGPEGTSFRSASIRLRVRVRLVDISSNLLNLTDLGLVSASLVVGNLDLVVDVAPGLGVISLIDTVASAVNVHATPGVVSLFLGTVSDANLLDRTTPIDPATELGFAKVASLNLTVLNKPLSVVSVDARGSAVGDDSSPEDLVFTTPFPKTLTAQTQGDFLSSLVQELLSNLELQVGAIANLSTQNVNAVVGQVTNLLKGAGSLLASPLNSIASNLLNPLLGALGIGLGELDVQICSMPCPLPEGTSCDDGLYCTINEICDGVGHCGAGLSPCEEPASACLQSTCSESSRTCGTEVVGCIVDGHCFPAGVAISGTCYICDPGKGPFDFSLDYSCDAGTVDAGSMSGCGDGEFCDGGTIYLDGGQNGDSGIGIEGNVTVGLAGGTRCTVAAGGKRARDVWWLLLFTGLLVQRRRARA